MPGEAGARAAGANVAIVALVIVRSRHILAAFVFLKCAREQTLQTGEIGPTPCRCNTSADSSASQPACPTVATLDRKSTRLNSSHVEISYAVFCLKKKKKTKENKQNLTR